MKREIKFRAWDGQDTHYNIVPWQWDFVISLSWHRCEKNNGSGFLGSGGSMAEFLVPGIAFKEIMQYTGLKDKNGKEIYEGDILTYDERIRGFVKYIGCSFIIEWVGIDTYSDLLGWDNWRSGKTSDGSKYEVIGNIYQNPELLNQ